jgi:hypothetical protein
VYLFSFSLFIPILLTPSFITILLSPFSSSSLSFLLLYYNPLFSLPTTLCDPFHPLFPCITLLFHPLPPCQHTTPPSYTLTTCWLVYSTNYTQPRPLQSLTQTPSPTTTNTQGPQNPATPIILNAPIHSFSHPPFFIATFTNSPLNYN